MTQPPISAPLISVIVPVYNVAAFVEAALVSLQNQTLADFEAIVIDDGSSDDSGEIAARVIADDPRFRLIRQDNRGLSGARNTGLDQAQGEFIAFLDSDDRLAPDYLMQLWQALDETGADWVACAIRLCFGDGSSAAHSAIHGAPDLSGHPVRRPYRLDRWTDVIRHFPSAWNKLYRATLIEGLRFDDGTWFEDHAFFHRAACRTDHLLHLPEPLYLHSRDRAGQITDRDDDRIHEQFDVLHRMRAIMADSPRPGVDEGFARIASRLLWERSMALRDPVRRADYATRAAAFLADEGIAFTPDWDADIGRSWAMEMAGEMPLSVVLPWDGRDRGGLAATIASVRDQIGPGREVLVICPASARTTATEAANDWQAVRVLAQTSGDPGRRLAQGLHEARGHYVIFLSPGDLLRPAALHGWCNLMQETGADCALAQFHQGTTPDAPPHNGFDDMGPLQGKTPAAGRITLTPMAALATAPTLSTRLFRRGFLLDQPVKFTRGINPHWALDLTTLLTGQIAYFDQAALALGMDPAPRPPRARALTRSHAALLRALPDAVTTRLPPGWQRRLYARALWCEVNQTRRPGKPRFLMALAGAALGAVRRGYTGPGRDPAGFDRNFGPRLARLLNPISLIGGAPLQPHAPLSGDTPPDLAPDLPKARLADHAIFAFPLDPDGQGLFRFRADFHGVAYANLSFFAEDGLLVPFHLSLRIEDRLLVCNDSRADGSWRAERVQPLDIPPEGLEVTVEISATQARVRIADETVVRTRRRSLRNRAGFTGFDRITRVGLQGGVMPLDILPAAPPDALILDPRLQLRAARRPDGARLLALPAGEELPLTATPLPGGGLGLVADLPGRLWQDVPDGGELVLELTDAPPLQITRADMAARIDRVLTHPPGPADSALSLSLLDHVRHGGLHDLLRAESRSALGKLAQGFGLGGYLAAAPDPALAPARDRTAEMIDAALARFHHSQQGTPSPDPFVILDEIALPYHARRGFFLGLADVFCRDAENGGGDVERFCRTARDQGVKITTLPPDPWSLSACLPFLYYEGQFTTLETVLTRLGTRGKGWVLTPPLAWLLRRVASDPALPDKVRGQLLELGLKMLRRMAGDYWERTHCRELTLAAAELFLWRGHEAGSGPKIENLCLEVYGLSRLFWSLISERQQDQTLSPRMTHAQEMFAGLTGAIAADDRAGIDRALGFFDRAGSVEAPRLRVELLGPAGLPGPVSAPALLDRQRPENGPRTPGTAPQRPGAELSALRHLAFPGTTPAPDLNDLAARALPALYPETPRAPDLLGQQRIAETLETLLGDPAGFDPARLDGLLAGLDRLAGGWTHYLGLGLGLMLCSATSEPRVAGPVQDWLEARLDALPASERAAARASAPVRAGLARPLPGDLHALFEGREPGMEWPDVPASPLYDTIITIFSCRAYEETRMPAIHAGWLTLLDGLGIPYVFVTGDGDGRQEGDIVRLDCPDDYEGLPQKTLAAIAWVHDHTRFGHMLKIDDDCFLDAPLFFRSLSYRKVDYYGRKLTRGVGQMDRAWHQEKSTSARGRFELDRSPEPSFYADGGSAYTLSRHAMSAALDAAASPAGQRLIRLSFMEDKMLGDLLALRGIHVADEDYRIAVRRRTHTGAVPVPAWVNSFNPSRTARLPLIHLDNHADQQSALALRDRDGLFPPKIWPGFQPPMLGYQSNALELLSHSSTVEAARAAQVAVVAAMRNEMFMLPTFLAHYRRLGVGAFLIADNTSDDGSREYLLEQPDVALFSVDTDYSRSHYGVAWQQAMMAAFRVGKWSLVADADELLVWQETQVQTLPELLATPDFETAEAARIFMLDMYPQGPLSAATFATGDPFAEAGFCDARPFLANTPARGPYSDAPVWTSALRHRLLPGSRATLFVAQKLALLKYHPFMRLSDGLHFVGDVRLSPRELIFAHFKYNAAFRAKAEAEVIRGQHWGDAEEYRKYLALISEGREVIFDPDLSLPWAESRFVRKLLRG